MLFFHIFYGIHRNSRDICHSLFYICSALINKKGICIIGAVDISVNIVIISALAGSINGVPFIRIGYNADFSDIRAHDTVANLRKINNALFFSAFQIGRSALFISHNFSTVIGNGIKRLLLAAQNIKAHKRRTRFFIARIV